MIKSGSMMFSPLGRFSGKAGPKGRRAFCLTPYITAPARLL
jgi:hypothetical protein